MDARAQRLPDECGRAFFGGFLQVEEDAAHYRGSGRSDDEEPEVD
jgi:hypothetical protein